MIQAPTQTTLILPKNSGLAQYARKAATPLRADDTLEIIVRGEDVPMLACEFAQAGQRVIALTGEDLLEEWKLRGGLLASNLQVRRIEWNDPDALFGKPSLCAIGPPNLSFSAGRNMRIGFCRRYRELSQRYVNELRAAGIYASTIALEGSLEMLLDSDMADLIVDIVLTGRTIRQRSLEVHDVLFSSDLALLESR